MADDGEKSVAGVRWSGDSQHYVEFIYLFYFIWMTHHYKFLLLSVGVMGSQAKKDGERRSVKPFWASIKPV